VGLLDFMDYFGAP